MVDERIVAVGFLTQRDLDVLGGGFNRLFPIERDDVFADLLRQLDDVEASPSGKGVLLQPGARH